MEEGPGRGNARLILIVILVIGLVFSAVVLISVYRLKEQVEGTAPAAIGAPR